MLRRLELRRLMLPCSALVRSSGPLSEASSGGGRLWVVCGGGEGEQRGGVRGGAERWQ